MSDEVWNKEVLSVMNKFRRTRDSSIVAYIEEAFKQERTRVLKKMKHNFDTAIWESATLKAKDKLQFKRITDGILNKVKK